ncbi:alpha/beta hydrolase [Massilia sp. YMA4]|uniref:alpha/beta hydrolase n=1 Tax=Massilia sp. YMA4 TaxID=1593482 RepID=UPI000DD12D10|nr:alpha/beta hydrolase [Massilia sp. YMA4]AXA94119.1 alpha/beta hydrolase [Massilia sp. YMA4]
MKRLRYIALGVMVALLAWGYVAFNHWQREMIFMPSRAVGHTPPNGSFSDQWIDAPAAGGVEGGKVHAWWLPAASPEAPALLYLHGNADTLSTNVAAIDRLRQAGFAVLAIDYRGFGASAALLPEERSAYADARAAWQRLEQLAPRAVKRLAYGHSLGGAIAVELAATTPRVDGVVVEGSFTSVVDVAKSTEFDWMPLSLVVSQRFASDEKVAALKTPKLFIHCARDEVIPLRFGDRLYEQAGEPKSRLVIPGGDHNDCPAAAAGEWRDTLRRFGGISA